MCKEYIVGSGVHDRIVIGVTRDASMRADELVIINENARTKEEGQGIKLICHDNGKITFGYGSKECGVDLIDGIDII